MKLEFHTGAIEELRRATKYYNSARQGLGVRFTEAVDEALQQFRDNPRAGTPIARGQRRLNLKRFPYSVIVQVSEPQDLAIILAVAHQKRKPGYWRRRLKA